MAQELFKVSWVQSLVTGKSELRRMRRMRTVGSTQVICEFMNMFMHTTIHRYVYTEI